MKKCKLKEKLGLTIFIIFMQFNAMFDSIVA